MTISKDEAASALREIDLTTTRSETLDLYRRAGPILMIWGVIWTVGYVAMGLLPPQQWGSAWLPIDVAGIAATIWWMRRVRSHAKAGGELRSWMATGAILLFILMTLYVFRPVKLEAMLVFPGLIAGLVYMVYGMVRLPRLAVIGLFISLGAFLGFVFLQPWLAFWMAAVGGGGLFLGGYWARKV
jgi:hypothetical protein